ncbi:MAG: hypothetical protein EXQ87_00670 [Alphaproteobacteria bacterium]|nr:hypothetical protein [Alphaproteobacteria bacterium]
MRAGTVHIVGAGLAGLAAAVTLRASGRGLRLRLWEASGQAGGRCRSFDDALLGCHIDNGNHLMLGANPALFRYLGLIGAGDGLFTPADTSFPFVDLGTGTSWRLRPNPGRLPWWLLVPGRRVPDTSVGDYLGLFRLLRAGADRTVGDCLAGESLLFRRLWEPLTVAVLNAAPNEGAAQLLARVVRDTFFAGGAACRPYMSRHGLSEALIDPAVAWLARSGASLATGSLVRALAGEPTHGRVGRLLFGGGEVTVAPADRVVLAVPPQAAARLVPGLGVPDGSRAIVNVHYRLPEAVPASGEAVAFVGIVGGTAQWMFRRGALASVTVSAADALCEWPEEAIAARLWPDVAQALRLLGHGDRPLDTPPVARVIKEKRATFLQSPANERRRPRPRIGRGNLFLAGDWTDTGLPATIEGAIRSGAQAAKALLESLTES